MLAGLFIAVALSLTLGAVNDMVLGGSLPMWLVGIACFVFGLVGDDIARLIGFGR